MAATATATPRVAQEIARRLGLREWVSVSSGFDRPNLTFDVFTVEGKGAVARKRAALLHVLSRADARPAIVYCGTRKDTDEVARWYLRARHRDGGLPRRHAPRDRRAQAKSASWRRGRGGCRDERLRHGRRQGRRAHGGPLGSAHEPRGLLPGGRPRRARRPTGAGAAARGADGPRPADPLQHRARHHRGRRARLCGRPAPCTREDGVATLAPSWHGEGRPRGGGAGRRRRRPHPARRARAYAAVDRRARRRGRAGARQLAAPCAYDSPAAATRARPTRRSKPPRTAAGSPTGRSCASCPTASAAAAVRSSTTSATPRRAGRAGAAATSARPT